MNFPVVAVDKVPIDSALDFFVKFFLACRIRDRKPDPINPYKIGLRQAWDHAKTFDISIKVWQVESDINIPKA